MDELLGRYQEADQLGEELRQNVEASAWLGWLENLESCAPLAVADPEKHRATLKQLAQEFHLTEGRLREGIDAAQSIEAARSAAFAAAKAQEAALQGQLPPSLVALTQQLEAGNRFREALIGYRTATKEATELRIRQKWRE